MQMEHRLHVFFSSIISYYRSLRIHTYVEQCRQQQQQQQQKHMLESYIKPRQKPKPNQANHIVLLHSTHSVTLIQFDDEPSTEVNTMRNSNAFITHFHRNFSPLHSK